MISKTNVVNAFWVLCVVGWMSSLLYTRLTEAVVLLCTAIILTVIE